MGVLFRIGSLVAALSYAVFGDVKTRVVSRAVDMTWASRGHHSTRVTIDNMRALLSREAGESDLATSQCVFAQVLHPLGWCLVMACDVRVLTTVATTVVPPNWQSVFVVVSRAARQQGALVYGSIYR